MHLGSLVAAVASYLDARQHGGRWLLRMEDLDTARVVPGSADEILRTLEFLGMHWDGEVAWQSRRTAHYAEALAALVASGLTFECSCSRRELSEQEIEGYPGTCRSGPSRPGATATRFRIDEARSFEFRDRIQGHMRGDLGELGDVIVRRRDGAFAYQLAVVVDDALQGVTDVVRGGDLLASTAWQMELQRSLRLPGVRYAHVPLVVEPDGSKLAKSRRSLALGRDHAGREVAAALRLLALEVPAELAGGPPAALLEWATPRWTLAGVRGRASIPAPA